MSFAKRYKQLTRELTELIEKEQKKEQTVKMSEDVHGALRRVLMEDALRNVAHKRSKSPIRRAKGPRNYGRTCSTTRGKKRSASRK